MNEALKDLTPEEELIVCYGLLVDRFPEAKETDIYKAAKYATNFADSYGVIRRAETLYTFL